MRLILAEKKRLLLFSYASCDNRPPLPNSSGFGKSFKQAEALSGQHSNTASVLPAGKVFKL